MVKDSILILNKYLNSLISSLFEGGEMIKTKLFVQLPSVCTVIQYVYNYIHVHETFLKKDGRIYSTASPGQTE